MRACGYDPGTLHASHPSLGPGKPVAVRGSSGAAQVPLGIHACELIEAARPTYQPVPDDVALLAWRKHGYERRVTAV